MRTHWEGTLTMRTNMEETPTKRTHMEETLTMRTVQGGNTNNEDGTRRKH